MRRSASVRALPLLIAFSLLGATATYGQTPVISQRRVFASDNPFAEQRFGTSTDAHGTIVVVGAIGENDPDPAKQGRAEVWVIDPTTPGPPVLEAVLTVQPAQALDARFGAAVAIYRDYIVVGAPASNVAGPGYGAAYIFERVAGPHSATWVQTAELLPPANLPWVGFGRSVAIHGGLVVVGSISTDLGPLAYEKQQGAWTSISDGLDPQTLGGGFGWSVAVRGDLIAVGEPWYSDHPVEGIDVGGVHIFRRNRRSAGPTWVHAAFLTPSTAVNLENTGREVALTVNTSLRVPQIVLGAATTSGVRLVTLSEQGLAQSPWDYILDPSIFGFGKHFAIHNDELLISGDDLSSLQAVSLHRRDSSGMWKRAAYFIPSTPPEDESWGRSVAVSRDLMVVGSDGATVNGLANAGWASWVSD